MHIELRLVILAFLVLSLCVAGDDSGSTPVLSDELRHDANPTGRLAAFVQVVQIFSGLMESIIKSLGFQETNEDFSDVQFSGDPMNELRPKILRQQQTHAWGSKPTSSHSASSSLIYQEDQINRLMSVARKESGESGKKKKGEGEEEEEEEEEGSTEEEKDEDFTNQGEVKNTFADLPSRWPCMGGYRALPSTVKFRCVVGDNVESVDAPSYAKMSLDSRLKCTHQAVNKGKEICVCPSSHVWVVRTDPNTRGSQCVPRKLLVSPRLESHHLCVDRPAAALGLGAPTKSDYCFRVRRRARLELDVSISFRWLNDSEMMGHLPFPGSIKKVNPLRRYIVLADGTLGTYAELSILEKYFFFALRPQKERPHSLVVTMDHPLQLKGSFSEVIYPFSSLHLLESYHKHLPLNETTLGVFFGVDAAHTMYRIKRDLSRVGDECISGNTMYMEVGFFSEGIVHKYRFARLWIRFTDLPKKSSSFHYTKPLDPILLVAVAFTVIIGVGFILGIVWWCCHRETDLHETLVSSMILSRDKNKKTQ